MSYHNVDLKEAIKILSDHIGTNTNQSITPDLKSPVSLSPERANKLLERMITVYEKTFSEVPEGRTYLEGRGIGDPGLFGQSRIGYCNGTLNDILPSKDNIRGELKSLGILLDNGQERFKDCVVVPVFDEEGTIVTLYGRHVGNNRKKHLFLPNRPTGLWNSSTIKTYPEIILVESVIDALSLIMAGYLNVVSIQGTNGLKENDLDLLTEHGVQKIILLLDADEAGWNSMKQLKKKIAARFSCEVKSLPNNHDPNSYLTEHGAEKLAALVATAPSGRTGDEGQGTNKTREAHSPGPRPPSLVNSEAIPNGFAVTCGLRRYEIRGLDKSSRKLRATIRVEHAGKLHVDTLDFYSARSRRTLCQDITRIFKQPSETIEADINKLLLACENYEPESQNSSKPEADPANAMSTANRREAEAFGKSPDLIKQLLADYEKCGLVGEKYNKILCYLAAVSRKMEEPLSVLILSSSGSGKTALQDATLAFGPPEDVVKLTSLTGKALFYKDELSLQHKILALEEGDGADDANYAIRNLISAGVLIIESTIKDPMTGRLTTMENRVQGPTTVFITTTNPNTDPETRSRFLITSIDESVVQTQAILSFQRRRQTLNGLDDHTLVDPMIVRHQNFQRLLKSIPVVNPYAEYLSYADDRLQGRRDQPKYLNLINAIAFLRQMQKSRKHHRVNGKSIPYIEVDLHDITVANELANEILGHSLDELSRPARELLILLDEMVEQRMKQFRQENEENIPERTKIRFNRREIREFTGWANTRAHRYLKELVNLEYVIPESGRNGSTYRYRLAYEGQGKDGSRFVLGLKDVKQIQAEIEKTAKKRKDGKR